MKKNFTFYSPRKLDVRKFYIVTEPTKLSEKNLDSSRELDFADLAWAEKAQRLRARRWRKIKHQLV